MDRIQTLEIFIAVAETQSFSRGARTLGMSAPSATRGINALESRLGARLFTRTTRRVRLTEIGSAYLEDARQIVAQLRAADDAAAGAAVTPVGKLRITCPTEFGRLYVVPVLVDFLDANPKVTAEVTMVDRVVNIVEEGFDVAVRIGHLASSELSAVRVGQVRRMVCGSPYYLATRGAPTSPAELAAHELVSTSPEGSRLDWSFGGESQQQLRIQPRLAVSSIAAGISVAVSDWGLCRVMSYQVADQLARGELDVVLEAYEPDPLPIHLVHVEGRRAAAKVRSFIDFARDRLRGNPGLGWQ